MAFVREYYPSDAIKILNESEGREGSSGKAAHSMSRHLRHAPAKDYSQDNKGVGALHNGVSASTFAKRFENNPLYDDGNYRINSGWLGKGDMALLLCQLLNSPAGQAGLRGLDEFSTRAMVQTYFAAPTDLNGNKLGGAVAEIRTSAVAPTLTYHPVNAHHPLSGQLKSIKINKPVYKGVIRYKDIVGAVAVLDKLGNTLHLQTFFPLFTVSGQPMAEYDIGTTMHKVVTVNPNGKLQVTLSVK